MYQEELIQYQYGLTQLLNNLLKVSLRQKQCLYHLAYADVTRLFETRKCQKIEKVNENN